MKKGWLFGLILNASLIVLLYCSHGLNMLGLLLYPSLTIWTILLVMAKRI